MRPFRGGGCDAALLPPLLTAIVWTTINLFITALAITVTVAVARYRPKLKWLFAVVSTATIALPPYPNWLFWNETDGWFFWLGPSLRNLEIGANAFFFVFALLPFLALFWAVTMKPKSKPGSETSF
jgi:hypothetical protein